MAAEQSLHFLYWVFWIPVGGAAIWLLLAHFKDMAGLAWRLFTGQLRDDDFPPDPNDRPNSSW